MINISYDQECNAVVIEFVGKVDAAQGIKYLSDIPKAIPRDQKEFFLLVDLSSAESMDLNIKGSIKKAMELFNEAGVTKVIRIIPDREKDIGLNIMSLFHYSNAVKMITVPSHKEAEPHLIRK